MRLVLAHRHDVAARELVARWRGDAVLLIPADLHRERWFLHLDGRRPPVALLPSRPEVTSVLSRLAGIDPGDLGHMDPQDVEYAAVELDAFLRAWLHAWPGPVTNRPSTTCLNGPGWRPEQWIAAAAAAGLVSRPVRRRAVLPVDRSLASQGYAGEEGTSVTVVGDRWFGDVDAEVGRRLCAFARACGCDVLEATVHGAHTDPTVVRVSAWPDVSAPAVADALAQLLDGTP